MLIFCASDNFYTIAMRIFQIFPQELKNKMVVSSNYFNLRITGTRKFGTRYEREAYEDGIKQLTDAGLITDPEIKAAIVVLEVHQVLDLFGKMLQEQEPPINW